MTVIGNRTSREVTITLSCPDSGVGEGVATGLVDVGCCAVANANDSSKVPSKRKYVNLIILWIYETEAARAPTGIRCGAA